jgi:hypothetical protein
LSDVRFESVTARAFGPFSGRTLRFAPGMTVVCGPNESGKSSWHAALYAGLCGMRRAKGRLLSQDQEFTQRHKPWDGSAWEVCAVIHLDDGRRVELRHDLEGKVDCRATDADLGRDVSGEILHDGSPDGSRWLGLDRRSFLAIACVRQAELLEVRDDPSLLQDHLQRAAATAGVDSTAAAAIERIDDFLRDHVGQDRAGAVKPLRQAKERADATRLALEQARNDHAEYLRLAAHADALADAAAAAARRLRIADAARAAAAAAAWRTRLARARELAPRYAAGPPASLVDDDALAQDVAAALRTWQERPAVPVLQGPTAAELKTAIQALPPTDPVMPEDAEPSEDNLRALQASVGEAKARLAALSSQGAQRIVMALGVVAAAVGLVAVLAEWRWSGTALLLAGAALLWAATRARNAARVRALQELSAAENALGEQQRAARTALERRTAAAERAALESQLAARAAAEAAAADATMRRQQSEARLREVATACGVTGAHDAELAGCLKQWQRQRTAALAEQDRKVREWFELQALLAGGTLQALAAQAALREEEARRLAAGLAPEALIEESDASHLERLWQAAADGTAEAAEAKGHAEAKAGQLYSVPEAEEAAAAADAELARVRQLEETLTRTRGFLVQAQERVHRDVARVLADTIRPWLPSVTAQRYGDVRVDPQSLQVMVCGNGGAWRDAALLSHGTAEQVYLLLRVALARHLAKPSETCPLVLDDITVQCDGTRKTAVLQLLQAISRERQVILFSQEDEVRLWAEASLHEPQDRVECLDAASIGC